MSKIKDDDYDPFHQKHIYAAGERVNFRDNRMGWINAEIRQIFDGCNKVELNICDIDWNFIGFANTDLHKIRPLNK